MDAQVAEDLARLHGAERPQLVETTMRAFVKVYHRRPSFVVIWFRGRTNPAIRDYCRAHNQRMARDLFEVARRSGMVVEGSTACTPSSPSRWATGCSRSPSRTP